MVASRLSLVALILGACGPAEAPPVTPVDLSTLHSDAAVLDFTSGSSAVRGMVRDEHEAPVGGVPVLACSVKTCLYGKSEMDGSFLVPVLPEPADVVVKVSEDATAFPARAEGLVPVHVPGDATVDVGTVWVPDYPPGVLLQPAAADPQTIEAGDGLTLTLRRGNLVPPLGGSDRKVGARKIAPAHTPRWSGVDPGSIVAVYALAPFAATSKSKIAVRAAVALPAGTAVSFRTVSELDGSLSAPVPGMADGASVSTALGDGIVALTWLVITRN